MWSIFGILKPGTGPERDAIGPVSVRQKPFFSSPDESAKSERDAAALTDEMPPAALRDRHDDDHLRLVAFFAPPYF